MQFVGEILYFIRQIGTYGDNDSPYVHCLETRIQVFCDKGAKAVYRSGAMETK